MKPVVVLALLGGAAYLLSKRGQTSSFDTQTGLAGTPVVAVIPLTQHQSMVQEVAHATAFSQLSQYAQGVAFDEWTNSHPAPSGRNAYSFDEFLTATGFK